MQTGTDLGLTGAAVTRGSVGSASTEPGTPPQPKEQRKNRPGGVEGMGQVGGGMGVGRKTGWQILISLPET